MDNNNVADEQCWSDYTWTSDSKDEYAGCWSDYVWTSDSMDEYSEGTNYSDDTDFHDDFQKRSSSLALGYAVERLHIRHDDPYGGNGTPDFVAAPNYNTVNPGHSLRGGKRQNVKVNKRNQRKKRGMRRGTTTDRDQMWLTLPKFVMDLIVGRLHYSSFCSFRSVCNAWNIYTFHTVYLKGALMIKRNPSGEVPFGIICMEYSAPDGHLSYNYEVYKPLSHSLPASFGLLKLDGNVLAQSGGFALVNTLRVSPRSVISLVHLLNMSERRLPRAPSNGIEGDFQTSHFLHLDNLQSSFKVIKFDILKLDDHKREVTMAMQIYDSKIDSWSRYHCHRCSLTFERVCSVVELEGTIYCLARRNFGRFFHLYEIQCHSPAESKRRAGNVGRMWPRRICSSPRIERLEGGQLFIKDGNVMLGGLIVRRYNSIPYGVHIWKLQLTVKSEYYPSWHEVSRIPMKLMSEFYPDPYFIDSDDSDSDDSYSDHNLTPHVTAHGDYMWVTFTTQQQKFLSHSTLTPGIMCHMPSNSWWKLPECRDRQNTTRGTAIDHGSMCPAFLFS